MHHAVPSGNAQWLAEITDAIAAASTLASSEIAGKKGEGREHLYKFAAIFATKNRGVVDAERRQSAIRFAAHSRAVDFVVDKTVIKNVEINFMLAYMDAHLDLGLVDEKELDKIMHYVVQHYVY